MRYLTRRQADREGIARLDRPPFYRLFFGVYAELPHPPQPLDYVRGARLIAPDAVASGATALAVLGAPSGQLCPLVLATDRRLRRQGLTAIARRPEHGSGLVAPPSVALRDAALAPLDELACADWLLRKRLVRQVPLTTTAFPRDFASPTPESAPESRCRGLFHLFGLPAPELQLEIHDGEGFVARVDFGWPHFKVCTEYEGLQHATDTEQWAKDIRRYERLAALGWSVVRLTAQDLRDPAAAVRRVTIALRGGGWAGSPAPFDARLRALAA